MSLIIAVSVYLIICLIAYGIIWDSFSEDDE